jgi:hypothetical protein
MPWRELKPMDLKVMFIVEYLSESTALAGCARTTRSAERLATNGSSAMNWRDPVGSTNVVAEGTTKPMWCRWL